MANPEQTPGPDDPTEFTVEPMCPEDWPRVRAIYAEGLATGNATFETRVPDWAQWDASRLKECRIVARTPGGDVLGWAALGRTSRKKLLSGVAEVSIYVAESARRRGVGRRLLARLIDEADTTGLWMLQASVFPENEGTLRLHEQAGFRVVGRREQIAMLNGEWRDTLLLERRSRRVGGAD